MKTNGFNKIFYLLIAAALFFVGTSNAISQEKKKVIRVVEIDDKGEHVVKEIALPSDKHLKILTEEGSNMDSIMRDAREKMKIEQIKIDSLRKILRKSRNDHFDVITIPPIPPIPDFDFDFDIPEPICPEANFDFFMPDSIDNQFKMYYNEKGFDKGDDLSKILKDLENGTFDPKKWNMKELDADKMKDFQTNGKGDVIIFDGRSRHPRFFSLSRHNADRLRKAHGLTYINGDFWSDSLDNDSFESTINSGGDNSIIYVSPKSRKVKKIYISDDGDNEKMVKVYVMANDKENVKIELTNPSADELKMLEKAGFTKVDKSKQLAPESISFSPSNEKDKYEITFNGDEKGKVKVTIADSVGKSIFSDEFDSGKGKEVEIKDLRSGNYYIQAQQNGKTVTLKMEVENKK